jgi:hypothetical protein
MRRYLVASAVGLLLIAGQAAASDDAAVGLRDRIGVPSDSASWNDFEGSQLLIILAWVAITAGLSAWGASQSGAGAPASP